jgi:hypothetical protein
MLSLEQAADLYVDSISQFWKPLSASSSASGPASSPAASGPSLSSAPAATAAPDNDTRSHTDKWWSKASEETKQAVRKGWIYPVCSISAPVLPSAPEPDLQQQQAFIASMDPALVDPSPEQKREEDNFWRGSERPVLRKNAMRAGKAVANTYAIATTAKKAKTTTSGTDPATSGKDPATSGKHPATSGKHPDTSGKHPATSGKHPATTGTDPATTGKHPATSGKQPFS